MQQEQQSQTKEKKIITDNRSLEQPAHMYNNFEERDMRCQSMKRNRSLSILYFSSSNVRTNVCVNACVI